MALKVVLSCDFPHDGRGCPEPATVRFEATLGNRRYRGDYCDGDRAGVEVLLREIGAVAEAVMVNSKRRGLHTAKSGATFSTAEARVWLREQGLVETSRGRVSEELLQHYANTH